MGRPRNQQPTSIIQVSATPKLLQYFDDLIKEEGYGTSRAAVANNLIWRAIEELITNGVLDRRKGQLPLPTQEGE